MFPFYDVIILHHIAWHMVGWDFDNQRFMGFLNTSLAVFPHYDSGELEHNNEYKIRVASFVWEVKQSLIKPLLKFSNDFVDFVWFSH